METKNLEKEVEELKKKLAEKNKELEIATNLECYKCSISKNKNNNTTNVNKDSIEDWMQSSNVVKNVKLN
jgi:hypothetical protein